MEGGGGRRVRARERERMREGREGESEGYIEEGWSTWRPVLY